MRQIVLDTETTGLSPEAGHRIIEIGALEMVNRRLTGKQFHYYLNPDRDIDYGAQKVHGITRAFLKDKPRFAEIAHELLAFIRNAELIIHNAPFDIGFLNYELALFDKTLGVVNDYAEVIDSLILARKQHPNQKNSLDALTKRYEIDCFDRELHGALLDAKILAQVYLAMTGGQADLSLEIDQPQKIVHRAKDLTQNNEQTYKIIYADETELATHQQYLQTIKEANRGKCVWLQD
ncbi:MAG: DNA polymerase III subunit epsilon [Gammaproteobacteria bacterium]|jgi:DNA polymerase-3 subunit epsilon